MGRKIDDLARQWRPPAKDPPNSPTSPETKQAKTKQNNTNYIVSYYVIYRVFTLGKISSKKLWMSSNFMYSMSDPINSISHMEYPISSSGIPHIQRRNTPYPSLENPKSRSGIILFPQWNTPYPAPLRHHLQHHPHKMTLRLYQNHTPVLPKSLADSYQITPRLYQNHTRLYQNHTRLYQNHTPTLPKSHSDFTKITLRLYQNHTRLYQNHTPTLPQSQSDFTKIKPWLCLKPPIPSYNYICKIKWKHQPNTYLSPSFSML